MNALLDTLLVRFRRWDDAHVDEVAARYGGTVTLRIPPIRYAAIRIDHTKCADLFLAFQADPDVEDLEIDAEGEPCAVVAYHAATNDPLLDWLHCHKRMNVFAAWRHTKGEGALISVVDDGMSLQHRAHPLFAGKSMQHWNSAANSDIIYDEVGSPIDVTVYESAMLAWYQHGIGCMTAACADGTNDGEGPVGVAPKAALVNMRQSAPGSSAAGSSGACAAGLTISVDRFNAKIISVSFSTATGTMTPATFKSTAIGAALDYVKSKGALAIFAGGNDNHSPEKDGIWNHPAGYCAASGHLGVGCLSHEDFDKPTTYSNHGSNCNITSPGHQFITLYEFAWGTMASKINGRMPPGWTSRIPGMAFASGSPTQLTETYRHFDGTSLATPLVAGVAALVSSINPELTGQQIRDILLATTDKGQHPDFYNRFNPTTGVVNALKAVLLAKAQVNPGVVYPYVSFFGRGASVTVSGGVATTHLRGAVQVEVTGVTTGTVTGVELWADGDLLYSGAPRTTWDSLVTIAAARLVGKQLRVVVHASTGDAEETYSDVVGYDVGPTPPHTRCDRAAGEYAAGTLITLSADSDHPPVRISYRWGSSGPWSTYAGPIAARADTLNFYGVDCMGNIEGGVDHALL